MALQHPALNAAAGDKTPAESVVVPERAGLVARVRQRLFPASSPAAPPATHLPAVVKQKMSFQASIAELLLVNRLKARSKPDQASHMLERASHIIFVTCKNWFSAPEDKHRRHETRL